MKTPFRLWSLGVHFLLLITFLLEAPIARAQYTIFGLPSAPYKNQNLMRDRLDSIQRAANDSLDSHAGQLLYQQLNEYARTHEKVKKAMNLEFAMIGNQETIAKLEAMKDSLLYDAPKNLSRSQVEVRLQNLETQIHEQKKQLASSSKAKKAQFMAKAIGAALTAVSLYFQVRNIKDAIRRVQIKELDLTARKSAMVLDANKLEVLNRKFERMRLNMESLQNTAKAGAAELLAAEQALLDATHELDQWKDVMNRSSQKILDAEETAKIDARSIFRQKMSVGITTIGVLVVSLFGDKIILAVQEWLESDDPAEQEEKVLAFLQDWWKVRPRIMEASLLPSMSRPEVTPEEKSAIFFMSSQELGVKPKVLEKALARYKKLDPHHYGQLQGTAQMRLKKSLIEQMRRAETGVARMKEMEDFYESGEWKSWRYTTPRDNTYVAPRVLPMNLPRVSLPIKQR